MARHDFKSDRHAALSNTYPPEVTHCGGIDQRAARQIAQAFFGPYRKTRPITLTWRTRLSRALRSIALTFRSSIR